MIDFHQSTTYRTFYIFCTDGFVIFEFQYYFFHITGLFIHFFDEIKLVIIERYFIHLHYFAFSDITVTNLHKDLDTVGVQIFFTNVKHNL